MVKIKHIILVALAAILVAGCNPGIIDAPTTNLSNIKSYFWKTDSSNGSRYARIIPPNTKVVAEYSLVFDRRGSNSFTVRDAFNTTSVPFTVHADSGNITIANLSPSSLIPLPERFKIVSDRFTSDTIRTAIKIKTVLVTGREQQNYTAIALDDSGRIYHSSNSGESWTGTDWNADKNGEVTALAVSPSHERVYAGTSTGTVFVSIDKGMTWNIFYSSMRGSIAALCVSMKGNVYVSTPDLQVFPVSELTRQADLKSIFQNSSVITSLAVMDPTNGTTLIPQLIGGTKGGLIYALLSQRIWTKAINSSIYTNIQIVPHGNSFLAIGTTTGGLSKILLQDTIGKWFELGDLPTNVKYLSGTFTGGFSYAATELGKVYTISTDKVVIASTTAPIPRRSINGISGLDYCIMAATDSGVSVSTDRGMTWKNITSGLEKISTAQHETEGELTILQSKGDSLKVGSSWKAGDIKHESIATSIPITAMILAHYDLFTLPDRVDYKDVFEVNYSGNPNIGITLVNLKIYFAKNVGPIMIDQYLGTTLVNRTYYRK